MKSQLLPALICTVSGRAVGAHADLAHAEGSGATDEIGHRAVENRVRVHDFHATMLNLLGMNYRDLYFERHSLRERLTDQYAARVVKEVLV